MPDTPDTIRSPDHLDLDQLEVSSGLTGRKHLLSLMVENRPGVLARVAGQADHGLVRARDLSAHRRR